MTNHVRCHLLNDRPWSGPTRPVGEEYIPADYVVRRLPPNLAVARELLFGHGADRVGRNLTLARLMAFVHASPLFEDVLTSDSRITYDPNRPSRAFDSVGPSVTGPDIVGWVGTAAFDETGRGYGSWTVVADGAGNYTVTEPDGSDPVEGAVTVIDSGDLIPLTGSLLNLVVPTGASDTWEAAVVARPTHTFAALSELADASSLFRPSGTEAEQRWYRIWIGGGPPALRAAAAALALAARTEAL